MLATDHLLPFPTLLSARQLSVLAMASEPRFAVNTDADINQLLKEAVPPNTRKSTDMCVSVFNKFCSEQDINLDLAICSANELNDALCKFYPSLRTKAGGLYRKASYLASRGVIHRRTQELKRPFNVFKSEAFAQSHRVLDARLKTKKSKGWSRRLNTKILSPLKIKRRYARFSLTS